jgi:hypothetical protein
MVDEARAEIEDDADLDAIHIPPRTAFHLRPLAAREIGVFETVDLGGIGGD